MTAQLLHWQGEFGDEYTDRNHVDPQTLVPAFMEMLCGLDVVSVLEVGCNRGHNLQAIRAVLPRARLAGVDPNQYALNVAAPGVELGHANAFHLPYQDGEFDLVFTCGVLIHVAAKDLSRAIKEMYRVSDRYLLVIEYHAPEETPVRYRGHDELLWKRDFGREFMDLYPDLGLVWAGFLPRDRGFDDCHWWLFEK